MPKFNFTFSLTGFRTEAEALERISELQNFADLMRYLMRETARVPKDYAAFMPVLAFMRALPESKRFQDYFRVCVCDPIQEEDPDGTWKVWGEVYIDEKPFVAGEIVRLTLRTSEGKNGQPRTVRCKGTVLGPAEYGRVKVKVGDETYEGLTHQFERGR